MLGDRLSVEFIVKATGQACSHPDGPCPLLRADAPRASIQSLRRGRTKAKYEIAAHRGFDDRSAQ
jgi:hypothetical protein